MIIDTINEPRSTKRQAIQSAYTQDEDECLEQLLKQITLDDVQVSRIQSEAQGMVEAVRRQLHNPFLARQIIFVQKAIKATVAL